MEQLTAWRRTPICICVWNPLVNSKKFIVLSGGAPKARNNPAEWYGKLWRPIAAEIGKADLTFCKDVETFPEDNLMDLREKVYLATDIPLYRQHLYMRVGEGSGATNATTYSIYTDAPVDVDISAAVTSQDRVLGMPIDRAMYAARDYLQITSGDTFTLLSKWMPAGGVVWCVDLKAWTGSVSGQLADSVRDRYITDLIYWGFIAKYWPIMTNDVFLTYATGETNMRASYPLVAVGLGDLRRKHAAEREIVQRRYELSHKARSMQARVAITQFTAMVHTVSVSVNIRNLFEISRVSAAIPRIYAYVDAGGGRRMRLVRSLYDAPPIEPPASTLFAMGIVYAIAIDPVRYIWLAVHPTGRYYMRSTWGEDDGVDFADIYALLEQHVRPVIRMINGTGRLGFNIGSAVDDLTKENVQYQGLNISAFWKHPENVDTFRVIRGSWDKHTEAGVAVIRPTTLYDRVELTFRKGMYAYDVSKISQVVSMAGGDMRNHYMYLAVPFIAKKWMQNYGGRSASITMRETDVRVDVVDIREDEYRGSFYDYIFAHLWDVIHSPEYATASSGGVRAGRRVRQLRDTDPELYNMSKWGVLRKYSQICQGPRQPTMYTDAEAAALPARRQKALIKYWNFTKRAPVWYGCPQAPYPHMSFVTRVHPAGYCLPCCNKRARGDEAHISCLATHKYTEDAGSTMHVLAYGKETPPGRLSHIHPGVVSIFSGDHYLAGSPTIATPVPDWRLAHAAAEVLHTDADTLLNACAPIVADLWSSYGAEAGGRDRESLAREFVAGPRAAGVGWLEVISSAVYQWKGLSLIVIEDLYDEVRVRVPQCVLDVAHVETDAAQYAVIIVQRGHAYPIVKTVPAEYFKSANASIEYTFQRNSSQISAILTSATAASVRQFDLAAARRLQKHGLVVTRKYVNHQNMCYAILAEHDGAAVYLSLTYSAHSADGVPVDTAGLDMETAPPLDIGALLRVLALFRVPISSFVKFPKSRAVAVAADGATLYCYYNSGDDTAAAATTVAAATVVPHMNIPYDPLSINRLILSRAKAPEDPTLHAEQYRMSLYNLLVMHLSVVLDAERDKEMRKNILDAAKSTQRLLALGLSARDMGVIRATLQFSGLKGLSKRLDAPFDFDKHTLTRLQEVSRDDAIAILRGALSSTVVHEAPRDQPYPNVYTTCGVSPDQPFCNADGKLTIARDEFEELLPILADDLRNPLRAATVFAEAWSTNVMDPLKFTKYGNDIVVVYEAS